MVIAVFWIKKRNFGLQIGIKHFVLLTAEVIYFFLDSKQKILKYILQHSIIHLTESVFFNIIKFRFCILFFK